MALLLDDAKNQSSFLTWDEGAAQADVAKTLRHDFLVSLERADKLFARVGAASATGPHAPAGVSRGHHEGGRVAAALSGGEVLAGALRRQRLVDIATLERAI